MDFTKPFALQAKCSVVYDGRAFSVLELGTYLILYKTDKSIQIHGASLVKPLNYHSKGTSVEHNNGTLVCTNKSETLTITINNIVSFSPLELSDNQIQIQRTELDLVNKIIRNWETYYGSDFELIVTEEKSDVGSIDIFALATDGTYYIVEVKRKKASLKECTQLWRYVEHYQATNKVVGILACPAITDNGLKYLAKHNLSFLEIGFD